MQAALPRTGRACMHGEWQGAMSETSGKAEDLERRLRTGQENAAREGACNACPACPASRGVVRMAP